MIKSKVVILALGVMSLSVATLGSEAARADDSCPVSELPGIMTQILQRMLDSQPAAKRPALLADIEKLKSNPQGQVEFAQGVEKKMPACSQDVIIQAILTATDNIEAANKQTSP